MPDTPVEPTSRGPYDPSLEPRVFRLEEDMHEAKAASGRLETMVGDVRQALARIEATLPHLATKVEMAEVLKTLPHLATKAEMAEVLKTLPHLATRAEMAEGLKTLPHLATKAELADKPGKAYLVTLLAVPITAYAAGLAALAILK